MLQALALATVASNSPRVWESKYEFVDQRTKSRVQLFLDREELAPEILSTAGWLSSAAFTTDPVLVRELVSRVAPKGFSVTCGAWVTIAFESPAEDWSMANSRRVALIQKKSALGLSAEESDELESLQEMADARIARGLAPAISRLEQFERSLKSQFKA